MAQLVWKWNLGGKSQEELHKTVPETEVKRICLRKHARLFKNIVLQQRPIQEKWLNVSPMNESFHMVTAGWFAFYTLPVSIIKMLEKIWAEIVHQCQVRERNQRRQVEEWQLVYQCTETKRQLCNLEEGTVQKLSIFH